MKTIARYSLAEVDPANRLLGDYLAGRLAPGEFFAHDLLDDDSMAHCLRNISEPARLSEALTDYQQQLGAHSAAVENARLLLYPATPVVTVGQQPGLLTGPLYTPYKALTAISQARHLSRLLGHPAVPVFWAGCDDDDRSEADHCGCWDRHEHLATLRYPGQAGEPGQIVGYLPAGEYAEQVVAQLRPLLEGLPFAEATLDLVQETLVAGADLGEWFNRLMARLFSPLGLVVCDARLPEMRRRGAEIIRRELTEPLRTTRLVNEGARRLQASGYPAALTKPDDTLNLFLFDGLHRHRVTCNGRVFSAAGVSYTREDLLAMLEADPGSLVPNAVLRPVVQEYLFGSAAFVAGPNELCYWAELLPVFRALEVAMPPVVPRAGATLLTGDVADFLQQKGIDPLRLLQAYDQTRLTLLENAQPPAMQQAFTQAREETERLVDGLSQVISEFEPTLAGSALATHQRMLNEIERLERKALKAVERQQSDLSAKLERATTLLFPGRGLQERAINIICFLARFGPGWPEEMLYLLDGQEGYHLFVEI